MKKIKKALLLTLTLTLVASAMLFAACSHTHDYNVLKYDESGHWYECLCGEKDESTTESHKGGTATCTAKAECEVCEQTYGVLNANNHVSSTYTYTKNNDGTYNEYYACCDNVKRENVQMDDKTFTVMSTDCVSCSNQTVKLSMIENQFFMNAADGTSFDGTPFTLTITLPETYLAVTSIDIANVWTNSGNTGVHAWLGTEEYSNGNSLLDGPTGWGGSWVEQSYNAGYNKILASGCAINGNQVVVTVQPSAGSQVIFAGFKFTYIVEHTHGSTYTYVKNVDGTYNKCYVCCGKVVSENVQMEEKTFTVNSTNSSSVSCTLGDGLVVNGGCLFMDGNAASYTVTITLPDTYKELTSITIAKVATSSTTNVYLSGNNTDTTKIVNGAHTYGQFLALETRATSDNIVAAGYKNDNNVITFTINRETATARVVLENITFTYLVEKTA